MSLEATVFRRTVNDLIIQAAQAPTTGFTLENLNGGAIKNTGTELALNLTPVQARRVTWVSRTTFARVNGLFTRLDVPGFNCGSFFSLRYAAPYCAVGHSTTSMQVDNGFDTTSVSPLIRVRHVAEVDYSPKFTMGF